ncbi:MAG: hypothetical protein ABSB78_02275 [Bacteroidota bacterium]
MGWLFSKEIRNPTGINCYDQFYIHAQKDILHQSKIDNSPDDKQNENNKNYFYQFLDDLKAEQKNQTS